jgi:hypothetical protein
MFFALFAFYTFIETNRLKYLLVYFVLFYICFRIHETAAFIPAAGSGYVALLLLLPRFRTTAVSHKSLVRILSLHVGLSVILLPKLINFFVEWTTVEKDFAGSWSGDFALKVLYHSTPSIVFIAVVGLLLLFQRYDRRGLFLTMYCAVPVLGLVLARILHMNVSARYLLFILPGIVTAASYACIHFGEQLRTEKRGLTTAVVVLALIPSMQASYLYYTSEHGYRDRLKEAMQFVNKNISMSDRDQIFCVPTMFSPYDAEFYCKALAQLEKMSLKEAFIAPTSTAGLDRSKRVWLVTLGRLPQNDDGFWKWISENAQLLAEFGSYRGNQDVTTKVYLYSPRRENGPDNRIADAGRHL